MRAFLAGLEDGIDESGEFAPLIAELTRLKAITRHHHKLILEDRCVAGRLDISRDGTGYLESLSHTSRRDLLIEPRDLAGAGRGDLVIARRLHTKGRRAKAKVLLIVQRAFKTYVALITHEGGITRVQNIKTGLPIEVAATRKSLRQLPEGALLKVDSTTGAVLEVLGVLEDASVDEKISLALYDKDEHFSRQAENEAASWGGEVHREMYPHRADLRDLAFCTIDPNEAKDFDDAVYYDEPNHTLYVAIADVSEYVFAFGALDKEAMKRGFSIYFPHKSIPMLPRALSENLCSLKPDEDRLAFGFKIKLNPHTWEVEHEHIWEGIIRSHKRYTYDEIDRFLAEAHAPRDSRDELILPHLLALYEVTKKLRAKRLQDAFTFHTAEIRMHLDERERITSTTVEQETASHQLIEECMLLANCAAAKRESKGIFRTHEEPGIEKIERLIEDLALIGLEAEYSPDLPRLIRDLQRKADEMGIRADVDKLIIRAQKQARYTAQNIGHFGLGFARYTHFTSPIRRYSDLVLHRLLKAELRGEEGQLRYQLEHIDELCEDLSDLEREADRVAWDYMDRKFARWADERIGQEVRCKVTELGRTAVLTLDDELVGARLFAPDIGLELFEHVWARIESVDLATTRIGAKVTRRESV